MAAGPLVKNAGKFLTTQTPLKNAYKYNPWAFKPNEDNWYRQIGKSAVDDALDTRLIREAGEEVSPRMLQEFEEQLVRMQGNGMEAALAGRRPASPFFLKGELFYPMGRKPTITKSGKVSKNPAGKGNADYLIETSMSNEAFQPAYVKGLGLGVPTEVGQTAILKPNPSLRNIENFNFYKQDWLKGYKAIDTPTVLPGSSNSYQYQIRGLAGTNTSTGLTEENVADAISRQKDWLKSEEYVKRRSANTGETLQEVRQDRDKILSVAEDARFNLNSNITAQGQMTPKSLFERFPKVEIAKHANNPINTLEHETAHLYSPSIFGKSDAALHKGLLEADVANLPSSERGVYANYPTLGEGFDKTAASIDLGATENYLKTGPEQQVRHLNARADILKANSLPMDAQLTEAEVKPFIDDWAQRINKLTKDTKDPINLKNELDYDEIWLDEAYKIRGNLLKEYGVASDLELTPLQRKEYVQRTKEELTKNVTSVLNKAWVAVPGAIGVGVATQQKKKGGPVNKRNHKDLDNYFAQAWSKSRKTA